MLNRTDNQNLPDKERHETQKVSETKELREGTEPRSAAYADVFETEPAHVLRLVNITEIGDLRGLQ